MGRHLMPELNGSIWRPMSPLDALPMSTQAPARNHPDIVKTPGSNPSRSKLVRQLSMGQEAESWAADVLRSIDF